MSEGPDAVFLNEVLALAIKRFGNKVITARMIDIMRMSLAMTEQAYREGAASVKPGAKPDDRHVPPLPEEGHRPLPMAEDKCR